MAGEYGSFVDSFGKGRDLFAQLTDYPEHGAVTIGLKLIKDETFTHNIAHPGLEQKNTVVVNGEPVKNVREGAYTAINRKWKDGDEIKVILDMRGRVEFLGEQPKYAAIMRGLILLARDEYCLE